MKALFLLLFPFVLHAAEPRVLFLGDSITYDARWTTGVESALRGTAEFDQAEMVNVGLPSETTSGLSEPGHAGGKFPRPCVHERLARVLDGFKPTLVIACYGMNDGISQPPDPVRMEAYRKGMTKLKEDVEKAGARIVFITPPLFQADKPSGDPKHYDKVLDGFAAWLVSSKKDGWEVVDIRPALRESVAKAKAVDPAFVFAGDGVHPGEEGHRFMARAACDGLWPILELPGEPVFAEGKAFATLKEAQDLLKLAWLTKTKHLRGRLNPCGRRVRGCGGWLVCSPWRPLVAPTRCLVIGWARARRPSRRRPRLPTAAMLKCRLCHLRQIASPKILRPAWSWSTRCVAIQRARTQRCRWRCATPCGSILRRRCVCKVVASTCSARRRVLAAMPARSLRRRLRHQLHQRHR